MRKFINIVEAASGIDISIDEVANQIAKYVVHYEDIDPVEIGYALTHYGLPKPSGGTLYRALVVETGGKSPNDFLPSLSLNLTARDMAFSRKTDIGVRVGTFDAYHKSKQFIEEDDIEDLDDPVHSVVVLLKCECPSDAIYFAVNDALEYCKSIGAEFDEDVSEWLEENRYSEEDEVLVDGSKCRIIGQTLVGVLV